jgi:hypothetical protein
MNFAFGKNEEPLDLTKGGDAGSAFSKPSSPPASVPAPKTAPEPPAVAKNLDASRPNALPPMQRKTTHLPPPALAVPVRRTVTPPPVYSPPSAPAQKQEAATAQPTYSSPQEQDAQSQGNGAYAENDYRSAPSQQPNRPIQQNSRPAQQPNSYEDQGYNQEQPTYGQDIKQVASPYSQPPQENAMQNNYGAPQQQQPQIQMVNRKGRPITPKAAKTVKAAKTKPVKDPNKRSAYTGDRKKVLLARIAVFGILGVLVLAGLSSFVPKASGLSASDGPLIIQKVKENLGITDFPATTGEGIALGFSKVYLGYNPEDRDTRYNLLLGYAPEGVLSTIDPSVASAIQLEAANAVIEAPSTDEETDATTDPSAPTNAIATPQTGAQSVTDGPYLVRTVMIQGGESAIFTTKTQVNNKTWIYMEIPMLYNAEEATVTVSSSPTFVKPIGTGSIPASQYATGWNNDDSVVSAMEDDMTNYMRAWGAGDESTLDRFIVKDGGEVLSTPEAYQGLDGTVRLVNVTAFSVEMKPALDEETTSTERADFYNRDARVTVTWLEPESGLVYTQTYQLELRYVNNGWFIQDIHNSVIGANGYKDKV